MAPEGSSPLPDNIMSPAPAGRPSGVAKQTTCPAFTSTRQLTAASLGSKSCAGSGMRTRATRACASDQKNRRSRGLARSQIGVRLGGVLQRIGLIDRDLDRAGEHHVEQLFRHGNQILALGGIGVQRRAVYVERSLLRQQAEGERFDSP